MDAFTFVLESLDDTARLGTLLAGMMQNAPQVRALLLQVDFSFSWNREHSCWFVDYD